MEVKKEKGLNLIKYQDKWYYNKSGIYYQWFDVDVDWSCTSSKKPTIMKFIIPINKISAKKAKKSIDKLMKNYQTDLWFPDEDINFQKEIKRFVRKEKIKSLMI